MIALQLDEEDSEEEEPSVNDEPDILSRHVIFDPLIEEMDNSRDESKLENIFNQSKLTVSEIN